MPLQNRVDPFGELFKAEARGTMMGNRGGALHNEQQQIVRRYKSRRWITCALEFKERRRVIMAPNRYTELFFLDEAVAFAAGHRPCAECRRERFNAFRYAWQLSYGQHHPPSADEMDFELHSARIGGSKKVTYQAPLACLPDGSFVAIKGIPYLVLNGSLARWTPEAYTPSEKRPGNPVLIVLTPAPVVECFRMGYRPNVHQTAY